MLGVDGRGAAEPDSVWSGVRITLSPLCLSAARRAEVCARLGNRPLRPQAFQRARQLSRSRAQDRRLPVCASRRPAAARVRETVAGNSTV